MERSVLKLEHFPETCLAEMLNCVDINLDWLQSMQLFPYLAGCVGNIGNSGRSS